MKEEAKDVKEESQSSPEASTGNKEQAESASEGVKTQEADNAKLVENYKRALQLEREKRKKLQSQVAQPTKEQYDDDKTDTEREFEDVKLKAAKVDILEREVQDPTFKDRRDLVLEEMEKTGRTLEDADNAVMASLIRNSFSEEDVKTHNIRPTATPEPIQETSQSAYQRIKQGKAQTEEEKILARLWRR